MISRSYFTDWLSLLLALVVIVPGFYHFKKIGLLKIFILYSLLSFLQTSMTLFIIMVNPFDWIHTPIIEISVNVFVIFEAFSFLIFFYQSFSENNKRIVLISSICLFAFVIWDRTVKSNFYQLPNSFTIVEGLFFLFLSIAFYLQLFSEPPLMNIKKNHSFWMANGIFLLFASLVPLYLLKPVLESALPSVIDGLNSFNYIGYSAFFVCLYKSMLCKTKVQSI